MDRRVRQEAGNTIGAPAPVAIDRAAASRGRSLFVFYPCGPVGEAKRAALTVGDRASGSGGQYSHELPRTTRQFGMTSRNTVPAPG